jgi:hypothetical protein
MITVVVNVYRICCAEFLMMLVKGRVLFVATGNCLHTYIHNLTLILFEQSTDSSS